MGEAGTGFDSWLPFSFPWYAPLHRLLLGRSILSLSGWVFLPPSQNGGACL